ncbi:MAG: hypothetical protein ABI175_12245, partial [Polyangiales bacterium]
MTKGALIAACAGVLFLATAAMADSPKVPPPPPKCSPGAMPASGSCAKCVAGTYSSDGSACQRCLVDTYSQAGAVSCTACPSGTDTAGSTG